MSVQPVLRQPSSLFLFACGAVLTLLVGATPARAQFSGPALSAPAVPNAAQTPTTDLALLNPVQGESALVPGDLITVRLFGVPDYAPIVRVAVDGRVQLPLIGEVQVAGLTSTQAANLVAARLVDARMYKNPQVSIQITESAGQFATISGELHAIVPIEGSRRLLEVLAAAGTLPPTASHVITILRPGDPKPIVVDLGTDPLRSAQANVAILPRDIIIVSRVGVVYMLGAFSKSGAIPLEQNSPLTLIQATALSGGPEFKGKFDDLRIIRTSGLDRSVIRLDINKVLNGKAPDPILQADDIVFLPSSDLKTILQSGGISTLTSIVSLLLVGFR